MRTPSSVFGEAFMAAIREAIREEIRPPQAMATREGAADSGGIGGQACWRRKRVVHGRELQGRALMGTKRASISRLIVKR